MKMGRDNEERSDEDGDSRRRWEEIMKKDPMKTGTVVEEGETTKKDLMRTGTVVEDGERQRRKTR